MITLTGKRTLIIAEAGVNHNGSLDMAKRMVKAAAEAGADIIKFQTFKAGDLVSRYAPKAAYQKKTTDSGESQLEMIHRLELDDAAHVSLVEHCQQCGIRFLSTPFDSRSLAFLVRNFDLDSIKVSSGDLTNAPFLLEIARTGKKVMLSTGMSSLGEIEDALGVLAFGYQGGMEPSLSAFRLAYYSSAGQELLKRRVALLHCTTEYPAPFDAVNLRAIGTLKQAFGLQVGYSDHTEGIAAPLAAVASGASIIEKHFTLDRRLPGPDHLASLEPAELTAMVCAIRQVEQAMGSSRKHPSPCEIKNIEVARKSLVATASIKAGEQFAPSNLGTKRPGHGLSPMLYWQMLGRPSVRDYDCDEVIEP